MESELVSGFMTEHAAVVFVFFFLAEYASIVLICILNAILFLGGYLFNYTQILYALNSIIFLSDFQFDYPLLEGMLSGLTIGIKSCIMISWILMVKNLKILIIQRMQIYFIIIKKCNIHISIM